jgi:hypothetical protein
MDQPNTNWKDKRIKAINRSKKKLILKLLKHVQNITLR